MTTRQADHRDPGHQARDDPGLRREQPDRAGHRGPGGPERGDAGAHPGEGRLHRGAARLRRDRPAQGEQARDGPLHQGGHHARGATSWSCAPATPASTRSARRSPPTVFAAGAVVDVVGTSKGKGTAGVMKRHGFHGLGASHGTQRKHRSPGSIGGCATPGRVFKGLRMAGRMGNARVTTQNLTVHRVDAENGLLLIKGAVPGPRGGLLLVKTAAKKGGVHDHRRRGEERRRQRRGRHRRAPGARLRRAGEHRADAPGRRGPAGRGPAGHALHEDPRRGPGRRQEAVPAEGHRPGPPGLHARPAVRRRRRRRTAPRRATTRRRPRRR